MRRLSREELIELVERRYFAAMDARKLDEVLSCLADTCAFTIYPAGDRASGRDGAIRELFETAYATYPEMWHGNFEWVVDEAAQRIAGNFDVRLVKGDGETMTMRNGKFFQVRDGRLTNLNLYLSTSDDIIEINH